MIAGIASALGGLTPAAGRPQSGVCDLPGMGATVPCAAKGIGGEVLGEVTSGAMHEVASATVGLLHEVLGAVLGFLAAPVRPDLNADWFTAGLARMVSVSGLFAVVFFLGSLMTAVVRGSPAALSRTVAYTVGAFVGTSLAVFAAQGFITLVDVATAEVAAGTGTDLVATFSGLMRPLDTLVSGPPGQALLAAILAVAVALGALAVFLELFIRNVMIHVVVFFIPMLLVGTIWSMTRRWARRGFEFLAVLIFSKFVLYAVIALGWSALASADVTHASAAWSSVLLGFVLLVVAAFLPWLLFKLLPFMEAHVGTALHGRDAGRIATAPLSPVSSSMRTLDANLGRVARVAAVAGTGGTASAPAAAGMPGRKGGGPGAGGAASGGGGDVTWRPRPEAPTGRHRGEPATPIGGLGEAARTASPPRPNEPARRPTARPVPRPATGGAS